MYYRIKHRFEAKLLLEEQRKKNEYVFVADRILEIIGVLDDAYGTGRGAYSMGGYVLFFPTVKLYEDCIVDVWDFYKIEPTLYEYAEYIGDSETEDVQWIEKLFLLSSDDSLMLIYPQERG